MATDCTVDDAAGVSEGDALCVIGWDTVVSPARPKVARATRSKLLTSKTVYGIAFANAANTDPVRVLVAGDVAAESVTGLTAGGGGTSFLVATDVNAATAADQCRLIRVERPDGSEYVVGTCDEGGNLAIQPRASRDTSSRLVFNVKSYGVTGNGADETAISAAATAAAVAGGILHFPRGQYVTSPASDLTIPGNVQVLFDEGATLEPNDASVTVEGRILCHPNQTIFGGTGVRSAVTPSAGGLPTVTITGEPARDYDFVVALEAGITPGVAYFRFSVDGGLVFHPDPTAVPPEPPLVLPVGSIFEFPVTGITASFPAGAYGLPSSYSWSTRRAVSVGAASFASFNVVNFGAVPYDAIVGGMTDSAPYIQACIDAVPNTVGTGLGAVVHIPPGYYRIGSTINLGRAILLRGAGSHRYGEYAPRTVLLADDGVTGIRTWHGGMGLPDDFRADGCAIEDIMFQAVGHSTPGAYGLQMHTTTFVNRCTFYGFSSHGIYIDTTVSGSASNWQVQWSRSTENGGDGLHTIGNDSNNGLAIGFDAQANKGYGIYEASFLGCTYISCHTAENLKGGYCIDVATPGASSFIGCYHEADQPPNCFEGNNVTVLGGFGEAGETPRSGYYGGYAHAAHPVTYLSRVGPALTPQGTNPPTVRLRGYLLEPSVDIRIEITTAGYPDGKDAWGTTVGATAEYRWSIDGGTTWNGPFAMPPAHNPNSLDLAEFALGSTGLIAVFTPGLYSADNVWFGSSEGGQPTFFRPGSRESAHMAFAWGHAMPAEPGTDIGYDVAWNPATNEWDVRWSNSGYFPGMHFASRASLPRPGHVTFDDGVWFGTQAEGFNRVTGASADHAVGAPAWLGGTGINTGFIGWFSAGDLIVNRSNTTQYPVAWRARETGGWSVNLSGPNTTWTADTQYSPGESVEPTAPNGYIYRALTRGICGATEPTPWPTTRGDTLADNEVTWECVGPQGDSIIEPILTQSELLGVYTVAGSATLTVNEAQYERLKLDGAPGAAFALTFPAGPASGWLRVVWNATADDATIKASAGDPGVVVPAGTAYQLLSDGTSCVRVM